MRQFKDIQVELGLKKFLASELGTLYFMPAGIGSARIIVRHFDREVPISYIKPAIEIVYELQKWLKSQPELSKLIRVEQPIEVGQDFIARPHHTYYVSTRAYDDSENKVEPPEEFYLMQLLFRKKIEKTVDPKEKIIERILERSILQTSGKTYYNEIEGRFVIVDPKLTKADMDEWLLLSR